jgi:YegS/Rv2252/BmrU family lipid kinase
MGDESPIYLCVAAFGELHGAENALEELQAAKRAAGIRAAVVMQKDHTGRLSLQDVGLTPRKGALGGVVLGAVVGVLTGGPGLALAGLGGVVGRHKVKSTRDGHLASDLMDQISEALAPGSSAILATSDHALPLNAAQELNELGADLFSASIPADALGQLDQYSDAAYTALVSGLERSTARASVPYPRIHIVINPAAGKNEPILNTLNAVFYPYGIDWEVSVTHKYGDATRFARQAAEDGFDLVVGYGGDGTQHEIANGVIGTGVPMGVLPGGTGNGFANELRIPGKLEPAVKLLCTSRNRRQIDVAKIGDGYFVQRLFTGIEPEEQTSREMKDKYGTIAYLMRDIKRLGEIQDIPYRLRIDDQEISIQGNKCYVVNSGKAGTGLSISTSFAVDDGYLDVFMLSKDLESIGAAADRFLNLPTEEASLYYWRGQQITIDSEPAQAVWTDGEYLGHTPVAVEVVPGGLSVAVP